MNEHISPDMCTKGMVYEYIIPGEPTAWSTHKGWGKKSYSGHYKEKITAQFLLKTQHAGRPLFDKAIRVDFIFEMPIPKVTTKKIRKSIEEGKKVFHTTRKDRSNCLKFAEDCLTGVVIKDDNIICDGNAQKYYSLEPKTRIYIQEIDDGRG